MSRASLTELPASSFFALTFRLVRALLLHRLSSAFVPETLLSWADVDWTVFCFVLCL